MTLYGSIRWLSITVSTTAICLSGCKTLSPKEAKQQAETRWGGVRSKVKLQLAEQHFQRRQFADALRAGSEAIALDPVDAKGYALAAKCHLELGQAASAEGVLDAAAKAGVSSPDLIYLHGVVLELREDLPGATDAYRKAREADGKQVDFLLAEAECMAAAGQGQIAIQLLSGHLHAYDERGDVALLAARIAEMAHDEPVAIHWYRQAIAALPGNELVAEELGVLLAQRGECGEAVHLLRPLINEAVDAAERGSVRRGLARCYLQWDDATSAGAVLADYARRMPQDSAAQMLLAQSSLASNDLLTAAEAVRRLELHVPAARDSLLLRALLDWKQGRTSEAAARLEGFVEAHPSDGEAACLLGEMLAALEQRDGAIAAFERAAFADPGNKWATARLAQLGSDR